MISKQLFIGLGIFIFFIGMSVGYFSTSDSLMNSQSRLDHKTLGKVDRYLDLRYLEAMIAHHRSALELATDASEKLNRPEAFAITNAIKADEPALIKKLENLRTQMFGSVRDPYPVKKILIGEKNANIDLRFLNALIFHHLEGIEMTQEIRSKSSNSEILDDADAVENFLRESLIKLKSLRRDWYGI